MFQISIIKLQIYWRINDLQWMKPKILLTISVETIDYIMPQFPQLKQFWFLYFKRKQGWVAVK